MFVLLLCGLSLTGIPSVVAQPSGATIALVDARAEVAAALVAASATQAAAERNADQQLRTQRKQIEDLRWRVRAREAKRQTELGELRASTARQQAESAEAQENYVAALAARDPANAEWQRDLIVNLVKLGEATGDAAFAARALGIAQDMQQRGILAPRDAWMVDELKRRAGQQKRSQAGGREAGHAAAHRNASACRPHG